jgi:hypothetical protein
VPVLIFHLQQGFEGLDAGVGYNNVDTPELCLGLPRHLAE